jgi:tryptophanyl-tRNA synthetase
VRFRRIAGYRCPASDNRVGANSRSINVQDPADSDSFRVQAARSAEIEEAIREAGASGHRVLTGDRPTGPLHIGHYFGTLQNRVRLQSLGAEMFLVIADFQVLTDRDSADSIPEFVEELAIDYLSAGIDPERATVFTHSAISSLNQLLLPFLSLMTTAELERNPTVKDELASAGIENMNALMFTYPVHQAADILFCKADLVPVGRDQLPHLEVTRNIARRFNRRFGEVFPVPDALLSDTPLLLGLDGKKMSKSRGNTIPLRATADETASLLRKAATDSERVITYDPVGRPAVSNLLSIAARAEGTSPELIAEEIGTGGGAALKARVTQAINDHLAPLRARRRELEQNRDFIRSYIQSGNETARRIADETLDEVRDAMHMGYDRLWQRRMETSDSN